MDSGSMTIAARTLNISQPNVSRLISELERATELQLFERRSGRLFATAEANAFYTEVDRLFGGLESLKKAASDIKTFGHGSLRIAATLSYAGHFLPSVISTLRKRYPAAVISLQLRSSATIVQWCAAQQCDLGITWNVSEAPEVDIEPLLSFPGVCLIPDGHRLVEKTVIRPEDLRDEPYISFPADDRMRKRIDGVFEERHVVRRLIMETQYSAAIYALVAEGVGISIANPIPIREFSHRPLQARRFAPEIILQSFMLKPKQRPKNRLVDEFVELLKEKMASELRYIESRLGRYPKRVR